jgi:hypothetical protein
MWYLYSICTNIHGLDTIVRLSCIESLPLMHPTSDDSSRHSHALFLYIQFILRLSIKTEVLRDLLAVPALFEFPKASSCPVHVSSGQTTEETPPPTVGRVISYAVPVASKQSRQLVVRTCCNILSSTTGCPKWFYHSRFLTRNLVRVSLPIFEKKLCASVTFDF